MKKKPSRTCKNGHLFFKSTECPTCPICEEERKPKDSFLSWIGAPARRALENNGITTLEQLSKYSIKEVLNFHGMGKASLPILQKTLEEAGLNFKFEVINDTN
jgi:predicted RecB family nuclease